MGWGLILALSQFSQSDIKMIVSLAGAKVMTDAVQIDEKTVAVLRGPVAIASGITNYQWSSDGKTLLLTRTAVDTQRQTLLMGTLDGRAREIVSFSAPAQLIQAQFIPGSSTLIAAVGQPDGSVGIFRIASNGQSETVFRSTGFQGVQVDPRVPVAVLNFSGRPGLVILATGRPLEGPAETQLVIDEGRVMAVRVDGKGMAAAKYLNLPSGQWVDAAMTPAPPDEKEPQFWLREESASTKGRFGTNVRRKESWLIRYVDFVGEGRVSRVEDLPSEAFVSAEGEAELSPTGDAVVIHHQGLVTVRTIARVPRALFERLFEIEEQNQIMSEAKQVGTAFMIYAADWEDKLPDSRTWQSDLEPYAKDRDLFQGFMFELGNKKLTEIEKPQETVLGRKKGRFGTAVVYADGHVRWERNKA